MDSKNIKTLQKKLKPLLLPVSFLYSGIVNAKELAYDAGILKSHSYRGVKIISVGNIVAGGSGKTPVVIEIANALKNEGETCVVTGNYPLKDKRLIVVSSKGRIFKKPPSVPDEAYMIAKKTGVTVIVSKNRKAAIELSVGLNMRYVILDDALHHREINKTVEICVLGSEISKKEHYLPAGMIRTPRRALKRCDIRICFKKENDQVEMPPDCFEAHFEPLGIFDKNSNRIDGIRSAFIFCGIGNPENFKDTVESMGIQVKGYRFFEDHHIYSDKEIDELKKESNRTKAEILLTTYKDFVKIEDEDMCYLDVATKIQHFERIIRVLK